jgi:hypothetical protein
MEQINFELGLLDLLYALGVIDLLDYLDAVFYVLSLNPYMQ